MMYVTIKRGKENVTRKRENKVINKLRILHMFNSQGHIGRGVVSNFSLGKGRGGEDQRN